MTKSVPSPLARTGLAPIGLSAEQAAEYVGVSEATFLRLVDAQTMPAPRAINTRRVWDVEELRDAFKRLPRSAGARAPDQDHRDIYDEARV
jgi:excisionase family DNA binding protein